MDIISLVQDTVNAVVDCHNWIKEKKIDDLVLAAKSYLGSLKK